jgi:hypothetical protein
MKENEDAAGRVRQRLGILVEMSGGQNEVA